MAYTYKGERKSFVKEFITLFILFITALSFGQAKLYSETNYDTVKAQRFDTGKMWTFEDASKEYFKKTYNFDVTDEWLKDVRLSALQFASWCSASFVSADGLVMTNHHCVDFVTDGIQKEGENIHDNGFYAETLEDERKIPNVYVDQLVLIKDVTSQIKEETDKAENDEQFKEFRDKKISELTELYSQETGLVIKITSLYNGGKFSLYGYKRYEDVRMVFVAESEMGLYGGEPDNFTYPRYNIDFSFVRVYDEEGNPVKPANYFSWSKEGPKEGEPLFTIGRPGKTERLKTVAQYLYLRDYAYKYNDIYLNGMVDIMTKYIEMNPVKYYDLKKALMMTGNSAKVYKGMHEALVDNYLIARKVDFENELKSKVKADDKLSEKYGNVWETLEIHSNERREIAGEFYAYRLSPRGSSKYLTNAMKVLDLVKSEEEGVEEKLAALYGEDFDADYEKDKLALQAKIVASFLGKESDFYKKVFNGLSCIDAADYVLENSVLASKEKLIEAYKENGADIVNNDDPIFYYISKYNEAKKTIFKQMKEIQESEDVAEDMLGQVMYAVYGTDIPPDATSTLRINDGELKSYIYNGTKAPLNTTFYGLYNRYYSHKQKYPWNLTDKWKAAEKDIVLSTPLNFITTNDITGGSSGSPVINQNAEVVGIAFDGNMESLPGNFLYDTTSNRMVAVHSSGILEALEKVYKANRIVEELKTGKIQE